MQASRKATAARENTSPSGWAAKSSRFRYCRFARLWAIQEITAVPQTPHGVKGVINLRGKVIPVVDLRLRFGLEELEYSQRTCIIVVQIDGAGGRVLVGVIVDAVSEVLNLQATDIEDTPDFGTGVALPYLLGMAKVKGKVKILLDINAALSSQEIAGLGF